MTSPPSPSRSPPLITISEDLIPSLPPILPTTTSHSFHGLLSPPLLLESDAKEGCGGQLWPAGMLLAEFLLARRMDVLAGKTIVELGAGSGLVSLALALSSPTLTLYPTDLPPLLPLLHKNTTLNHANLLSPVYPSVLAWGSPSPSFPSGLSAVSTIPCPPPDVLLAADCVYLESAFPLLLSTMRELVGEATVCFFCYRKRRRADAAFGRMLRKAFCVVEVGGEWQREGLFLYEIRKRLGKMQDGGGNWNGTPSV